VAFARSVLGGPSTQLMAVNASVALV